MNPFQDPKHSQAPVTVPHSDSDLNSRKMVVLQEYRPSDNRGLAVRRGEVVQVIKEEQNWFFVRNERNKEGYVPGNHLVAPYSSMRTRTRVLGVLNPPPPMRHVASGSSIEVKDSAHHHNAVVPMYPSTSAGRPRNYSLGDENRINSGVSGPPPPTRRGYSPQELNGNSLSQGQNGVTSYDQKYSPSTSSGVASFTGTASPMGGHSDGSNHSSFGSIEGDRTRENGTEEPFTSNDERRTAESYVKGNRPHPSHAHGSNEAPPPPLPPRTSYNYIQPPPPDQPPNRGEDEYFLQGPEGDADSYASPADAIIKQQSPNLGRPRVRSLNDVRLKEIKRTQENGVYSEVFQGRQRPQRQNGYKVADEDSTHSEGGSSRSRSSRKSGSRVSSMRTQTMEPSGYYDHEVFSHESDGTVNEISPSNRHRPLSGNSLTEAGQTRIKKFRKNLWGVYIVMQGFEALDENEISIGEGEHVSVWNQDDRDWYWIVKHDTSEEGFVPSGHLKELVNSDAQPQVQGN